LPQARTQRAGVFIAQPGGFKAFIPKQLPPQPPLAYDEATQSLLGQAAANLGRLDSVSLLVPDPDRFVSLYIKQEAVLSSQIEGTQASLAELLDYEAAEDHAERTVDLGEVIYYARALGVGIGMLESLPVCSRVLREVHRELMAGVRGGEPSRTPGEFRRSQNWIGGSSPADARFVPPPAAEMRQAMSDLERFLNSPKEMPLLIEIGLAHAQFETIHPFLDGNGRLGRMMITFLLAARGELARPLLYLSHFFKRQRDEYYARLQAVRTDGDWEGWIRFFLSGVSTVAAEATMRARQIIALRENDAAKVRDKLGRRAGAALDLLDLLIERPVVTSRVVQNRLRKSQPTADRLVADLVQIGILREASGKRWGRRFRYHKYLTVFEA